ncbi:MAG: TRAP transporter small permease [Ottowia sp.]|nr:TRAP transporter small permease [Ottowia sp.]
MAARDEGAAARPPGGWFVRLTGLFAWLGVLALLVPTLLICADIIWRRVVGGAFIDVFDIAQLALVAAASWSIPFAFVHGNHISVDLLVERLPLRVQRAADAVIHLVSALLFALLAWFGWQSARLHHGYGDTTQNLGLPVLAYWVVFLMGLALTVLACLWRVWRALKAGGAVQGVPP